MIYAICPTPQTRGDHGMMYHPDHLFALAIHFPGRTMSTSLRFAIHPSANPMSAEAREKILAAPGFGQYFTDHMALIQWHQDRGWHDAQITARRPFSLDPACAVLHYAQEIFEGLKAYPGGTDQALLFRPEQNARRLMRSAERMPEDAFLTAVEELVRIDMDWIPQGEGASLYLRPFMFASETFLGVRPAHEYTFCVIASPAGAYFSSRDKGVAIWVETQTSRAAPGGTGAAKCGGNYAGGLLAQARAAEKGCDQVVYLDSREQRWVEELGGMNVYFVMQDGTLLTPPASDTILHGITRDALLTLARDLGLEPVERAYAFEEWQRDAASGKLTEVFACGTAAVITGIGTIRHAAGEFTLGDGSTGPVSKRLKTALTAIQRGQAPDTHGWVRQVRR